MINKYIKYMINNIGIKILEIIVLCLTAYLLFHLMHGLYHVVHWDFPNHCREAVDNGASVLFWKGQNPYYDNYPHHYISYGPLYYLFASLFLSSDSFLDAAFVQRTINVICTLLTMVLFVVFSRKKLSNSFAESLPLAAVLGTMLAFFSNELGSKPGCFAFLFAFSGVIIPYWCNFSKRSFVIAVSCCAVAFLSKQILLIFIVVVLAYHLLFFGIKRTFFLGLLFILQTYGLLLLLELIYPNIMTPYSIGSFSQLAILIPHLVRFMKQLVFLLWPIIAFVIIASFALIVSKWHIKNKVHMFYVILRENYLLFACGILFLYYVRIIAHHGNGNVYAAHTVVAFLFLTFLHYVCLYKNIFVKYMSLISLIITLFIAASNPSLSNAGGLADYSNSWKQWDSIIAEHNNIFAFRVFAQRLSKHGKSVREYGQEEYSNPSWSFFYKDELAQKRKKALEEIKNGITSSQYDLLLLFYSKPVGKYIMWGWDSITEKEILASGYVKVSEGVADTSRYQHYPIHVFKRAADIAGSGD